MHAPDDAAFMRQALALARHGRGRVHPNPLVGAVVVADRRIVAEGFHAEYGGPHAEVVALRAAGPAARGATLYVTLEPCAHHGKTPPCVDAVLAAGIARVVYAARDPDPHAAGGGARLRAAGVAVTEGVEESAARALNAAFFHNRETGSPWMALKLALSLDGGIAAAPGRRTRITGDAAQRETHRLRAEHAAVLIGIETALVDDPLLTVRDVPCRTAPVRVVLDSAARLPLSGRLVQTGGAAPVWVLAAADAPRERTRALGDAGVRVLAIDQCATGLCPDAVRATLAAEGLDRVLIEGGAAVAASFLDAGLLQRLHLFVAPCFLGADAVRGLLPARHPGRWTFSSVERLGADVLLTLDAAVAPPESA